MTDRNATHEKRIRVGRAQPRLGFKITRLYLNYLLAATSMIDLRRIVLSAVFVVTTAEEWYSKYIGYLYLKNFNLQLIIEDEVK